MPAWNTDVQMENHQIYIVWVMSLNWESLSQMPKLETCFYLPPHTHTHTHTHTHNLLRNWIPFQAERKLMADMPAQVQHFLTGSMKERGNPLGNWQLLWILQLRRCKNNCYSLGNMEEIKQHREGVLSQLSSQWTSGSRASTQDKEMGADLGDHSWTPSYQNLYLNRDGKSVPVYYKSNSVDSWVQRFYYGHTEEFSCS